MLNSALNYMLVVFAFLLPVSTPMTNAVMALLILLWLLEGNWKEKIRRLTDSKAFLAYISFVVFIGLSLLWSGSIDGGFSTHAKNAVTFFFSYYVFGFMIIPILMTSLKKGYISYLFSAFLLAMLLSEVMSWGIFMEWITYKNISPQDPSPFMHHTFYSIFLAVTIFILLTQFFQTKVLLYKVLAGIFLFSAMINLFLNGGRLGQLAFFIALLTFIYLRYKITLKSVGLSFALIIGVFMLAYTMSPVFKTRMDLSLVSLKKISVGDYNSSWGIRTNILIVAKEVVKEQPFLGTGIGNARTIFLEKSKQFPQTGFFSNLKHLHNQYMQILVETGIVGLLLFLLFLLLLVQLDLEKEQFIFMMAVVVIFLVGFVGEPLFFSRKPYLLFNFLIALFIYQSLEKENLNDVN